MTISCTVFRCGKQDDMYPYIRRDMQTDKLPAALLRMTGLLTKAMELDLDTGRKLARADTAKVMEQLSAQGYYLQLPPNGHVKGHLHFGD